MPKRIGEFQWSALYSDGSIFKQFDDDETEHGFGELDLSRVEGFKLNADNPMLPREIGVVINQARAMRPIFFYRRMVSANLGGGEPEKPVSVAVVGWQKTVEGRNVKSFCFIFEDGSILLSDDESVV